MKQGLLYTVIFTFIICFLFVFILAFVNGQVAAQIDENQKLEVAQAVLKSMQISVDSEKQALEQYDQLEIVERNGFQLYFNRSDDGTIVAKLFSGSGLWGTITGAIAVYEDFSKASGLEIIDQNETPGLGGRISEEWFTEQIRDEKIVDGTIAVSKPQGESGDPDKNNGSIDGITGATRTSDSIRIIIRNELSALQQLLGVSL